MVNSVRTVQRSLRPPALPQHAVKVVLVGDSGSGKTSFLNKYLFNNFTHNHFETDSTTIGFKMFLVSNPNAAGVSVEIWDTPSRFDEGHPRQMIFENADLVMICVRSSNKNTEEAIDKWLALPELKVVLAKGQTKVAAILTVCDTLSTEDLDEVKTKMFSFMKGNQQVNMWFACSAKEDCRAPTPRDIVQEICLQSILNSVSERKSQFFRYSIFHADIIEEDYSLLEANPDV